MNRAQVEPQTCRGYLNGWSSGCPDARGRVWESTRARRQRQAGRYTAVARSIKQVMVPTRQNALSAQASWVFVHATVPDYPSTTRSILPPSPTSRLLRLSSDSPSAVSRSTCLVCTSPTASFRASTVKPFGLHQTSGSLGANQAAWSAASSVAAASIASKSHASFHCLRPIAPWCWRCSPALRPIPGASRREP
jgi:hypothetical protein